MSTPAFQCSARSLSLPKCTPYHSSRDICYIFLKSCRNIPVSHAPAGAATSSAPAQPRQDKNSDSSAPRLLPASLALSTRLEVEAMAGRGSAEAKKRLPVFLQLCGEAGEELKKLPEAQVVPGSTKGWRMALAAAYPTCNEGMN